MFFAARPMALERRFDFDSFPYGPRSHLDFDDFFGHDWNDFGFPSRRLLLLQQDAIDRAEAERAIASKRRRLRARQRALCEPSSFTTTTSSFRSRLNQDGEVVSHECRSETGPRGTVRKVVDSIGDASRIQQQHVLPNSSSESAPVLVSYKGNIEGEAFDSKWRSRGLACSDSRAIFHEQSPRVMKALPVSNLPVSKPEKEREMENEPMKELQEKEAVERAATAIDKPPMEKVQTQKAPPAPKKELPADWMVEVETEVKDK